MKFLQNNIEINKISIALFTLDAILIESSIINPYFNRIGFPTVFSKLNTKLILNNLVIGNSVSSILIPPVTSQISMLGISLFLHVGEKSKLIQHTARLRIGEYIPYYISNGLTHGKAGPVDIFDKI